MMRWFWLALAAALAGCAPHALTTRTTYTPPDASAASTQALATANAALALASQAQAAVPTPYAGIPASGVVGGQAGTAGSYIPAGATPALAVQAINTSLTTNCTWSVTFAQAMVSATPIIAALPILPATATQPISCQVLARSSAAANGKCFMGQTTLVNTAAVTAGLTVAPFQTTSCTSIPVMVIVRDPTQ